MADQVEQPRDESLPVGADGARQGESGPSAATMSELEQDVE